MRLRNNKIKTYLFHYNFLGLENRGGGGGVVVLGGGGMTVYVIEV